MFHMIQAALFIALLVGGLVGIGAMLVVERTRLSEVLGYSAATIIPALPAPTMRRATTPRRTAGVVPVSRPALRAAA